MVNARWSTVLCACSTGVFAVEERQHGRVPSVAVRDPEKGSVLEAPHELKSDHVLIESLTLVEIVDTA